MFVGRHKIEVSKHTPHVIESCDVQLDSLLL